jgi:hypothetical protein
MAQQNDDSLQISKGKRIQFVLPSVDFVQSRSRLGDAGAFENLKKKGHDEITKEICKKACGEKSKRALKSKIGMSSPVHTHTHSTRAFFLLPLILSGGTGLGCWPLDIVGELFRLLHNHNNKFPRPLNRFIFPNSLSFVQFSSCAGAAVVDFHLFFYMWRERKRLSGQWVGH